MSERRCTTVLAYGGGMQTVGMVLLVGLGVLPRPDRIVMADTGREVQSTFDYLDTHVRPYLAALDLSVEVAGHDGATVDLYGHNGDLLLPAFTSRGKLPTFCSVEWKARVVERHLRASGVTSATTWIGFSLEERRRIKADVPGPWRRAYPLVEHLLTRADVEGVIDRQGWPRPTKSRCWMCPHQSNEEWTQLRDTSPEEFARAVALDEQIRETDLGDGVYLHPSRVPLAVADLDTVDRREPSRQCGLGYCFL